MKDSRVLYVGIKGAVVALDAATGEQLWATPLRSSGFVTLVVEGSRIYAATYGEAFCLDRASGRLLWHNPLKGLGRDLISLATENGAAGDGDVLRAERRYRDQQAAAAGAAVAAAG